MDECHRGSRHAGRRGDCLVTGSRYWFSVALGVFAAMVALLAGGTAAAPPAQATPLHSTTRTFLLGAGQAERRFLLRERSGVILLSRLTVPVGVRAYVDASIPHLAGTRFSTPRPNDPALKCTRNGTSLSCSGEACRCSV